MILISILAVVMIVLDQASKFGMTAFFEANGVAVNGSYTVIDGVLRFTRTYNIGSAFSMFKGAMWLFIPLTLIVCAGLVWWLIRIKHRHILLKICSGLILGGAIGNLIDRIAYGSVRDFIDVDTQNLLGFPFAVFNVADCCLVVGTILFAVYLLFMHEKYMAKFVPAAAEDSNANDKA